MRRGFGRRRRQQTSDQAPGVDPAELQKVSKAGLVPTPLEHREIPEVPAQLAVIGCGREADSDVEWWVARAEGAAAAAAAVLIVRGRVLAEGSSSTPRFLAVATTAGDADRRQLSCFGALPDDVSTHVLSREIALAGPPPEERTPVPVAWVLSGIAQQPRRQLAERAVAGLRGLAAKYAGSLRAEPRSVELCVGARPVAALQVEAETLSIVTLLPQRSVAVLASESLPDALDRLEGNLRRRLNDRKTRDGEEGLRGRLGPVLADHCGVRSVAPWPLTGEDPDPLDWVGVDATGGIVLGTARLALQVSDLLTLLGGVARARPLLPVILGEAPGPIRPEELRLVVAAEEFGAGVEALFPHLRFPVESLSVADIAALSPRVEAKGKARGTPAPATSSDDRGGRGRSRRGRGRRRTAESEVPAEIPGTGDAGAGDAERAQSSRALAVSETPSDGDGEAAPEAVESSIEELSLFDLDDETGDDGGGRRRRRRGRRRGNGNGRGRSEDGASEEEGSSGEGPQARSGRGSGRSRGRGKGGANTAADEKGSADRSPDEAAPDDGDEDPDVDDEQLLALDPDAPEPEDSVDVRYEDSELDEEPLTESEQLRLERERRRLARVAAKPQEDRATRDEPAAESEAEAGLPRGRPAILAHADRQSLIAATVLGRDVRNVEGIWVYPQDELMTFFRGVATDLRENTPVFVVGFSAKPSRDAIQAAALYRGRLVWFDHHEWPPEDAGSMAEAVGPEMLHLTPEVESSLAAVLSQCKRRSRFSDKLVDLATGRFSQHDYERWGRLWWKRLGDIAATSGPVGNALDALFGGRPSDLAREAGRHPTPDPPAELAFASGRDFRIVHFGGFGLAVVEVPASLDLHLCARIVRERHGLALSLGRTEGSEAVVLGSDDATGRRSLDCSAMVDHLVSKFSWAEPLPDDDHVARLRIRDLVSHPERFEELVSDIAMGRSILEG
ncbi:MAG: hypothetical protein HKP27_05605 [Myxococcales bacterium]|nr:hypothetical protein [Myxococcales bacterium]